jgi:taurine transport system permease protein
MRRRWRPSLAVAFFCGSAVFWLAAWWIAAALEVVPALFLPSPGAVAVRLVAMLAGGYADATLIEHAGTSLCRVLAALAAAFLVAVPVGIGMGSSPILRGIFDPIIEAYRPIPPLAYLPLVIIWFGIGEPAKVLLISSPSSRPSRCRPPRACAASRPSASMQR